MKLYVLKRDGQCYYILAWTFTEALAKWRESSVSFAKMDPDELAIAVKDIIGAPKKKDDKFADEPSVSASDLGLLVNQ